MMEMGDGRKGATADPLTVGIGSRPTFAKHRTFLGNKLPHPRVILAPRNHSCEEPARKTEASQR